MAEPIDTTPILNASRDPVRRLVALAEASETTRSQARGLNQQLLARYHADNAVEQVLMVSILDEPALANTLAERLETQTDWFEQYVILNALEFILKHKTAFRKQCNATIDEDQITKSVLQITAHESAELRLAAAQLLFYCGTPSPLKANALALRELLADADPRVRCFALRLVSCVSDSTDHLEAAVDDPSPEVASVAVQRLISRAKKGSPELLDIALDALEDDRKPVRRATSKALSEATGKKFLFRRHSKTRWKSWLERHPLNP